MRIVLKDATPLREIEAAARSPKTKKLMGQHLLSQAQKAFQDQRRGPIAWQPRAVPNVAGIVEDLKVGANVKPRRFDATPAGVDTGRLGRYSIGENYEATTGGFEVFSTVPYSEKIQEGGPSRVEITPAVVENLKTVMKRSRSTVKKAAKRDAGSPAGAFGPKASEDARAVRAGMLLKLGWLFAAAKKDGYIEITIPPRPFLTIEQEDVTAMQRIAVRAAVDEARK